MLPSVLCPLGLNEWGLWPLSRSGVLFTFFCEQNEVVLFCVHYLLFVEQLAQVSGSKAEQKTKVLVLAKAAAGYGNHRLTDSVLALYTQCRS